MSNTHESKEIKREKIFINHDLTKIEKVVQNEIAQKQKGSKVKIDSRSYL